MPGDSPRGVGFDGLGGAVSRGGLACGWSRGGCLGCGAPVSSPKALRRGRDFLRAAVLVPGLPAVRPRSTIRSAVRMASKTRFCGVPLGELNAHARLATSQEQLPRGPILNKKRGVQFFEFMGWCSLGLCGMGCVKSSSNTSKPKTEKNSQSEFLASFCSL